MKNRFPILMTLALFLIAGIASPALAASDSDDSTLEHPSMEGSTPEEIAARKEELATKGAELQKDPAAYIRKASDRADLWNGTEAPAFSLTTLDGRELTRDSLKGKFTVINMWATWCAPCRDELPELKEFAAHHQDDVVLIGVSREEAETVAKYARRNGINYPLSVMSYTHYKNLPAPLNEVAYLPYTFVIDRNGVVIKAHDGVITLKELNEWVTGDYQGEIKPHPAAPTP